MGKNVASVTVRMPQELFVRLKALAEQEHRSLSGEAAYMIQWYTESHPYFNRYYKVNQSGYLTTDLTDKLNSGEEK